MHELAITQRADGNATIGIVGRLDAQTCDEMEAELDQLLEQANKHIVFDLAQVDYISSAGIRLLLKARRRAHRNGWKVIGAFTNPQATRVFEAVQNLAVDALLHDQSAIDAYLLALSNDGD